ncbi:C4-dicarboxylate TRAP transporter large permease protein DctM [Aureimonas sp. SA4125]|uniref:TRAP transporter large permease n=1 Tax=Aureimonas sp. SA4125 TaxID=2826993 RepID=UPI001CC49768|nr:TRAP transporter large permease [Aureimonas sp. SA4125]BDA84844.1 C4-dicarboxylate TRAP transporter large permease protein DctM [Aureimonas sp. SA4125]
MILSLAILPLLLLAVGTPVFLVFLTAVAVTMMFVLPLPAVALQQVMFGGLDNYALLAIPFFVFAGELMNSSGIANRLINWAMAMVGRVPGSLGVATVGASTAIGAISGSSVAAVAALGKTLYPKLVASGYGRERAGGLIAASGAIDIVIPPSIAMILYGLAAEQSIPRLFKAGVLPALLMAAMMAGFVIMVGWRERIPSEAGFEPRVAWQATRDAFWALLMPVFVLGGIYLGLFSPTEAGGFACVYAIVVAMFIYRTMTLGDVIRAAGNAAMLSGQILIIVAAASVITWILTTQGVPQAIIAWINALQLDALTFLLVVNIALLVMGCFLDPTSAILVFAPLLVPIAVSLGIDPIHFGIVMTVNLAIGMFTPPFGLNIFVAQSVTGLPAHSLYRGVMPFTIVLVLALLIITYVPALSLTLGSSL